MTKNYQILKEKVNYSIKESGLDIGAIYFIMKDILNNIEHLYYAEINKEFLEESRNNEEATTDNASKDKK